MPTSSSSSISTPIATAFIPALLCEERVYSKVIDDPGHQINLQVMTSPKPVLADSVADILARTPGQFALIGTSYGGNLAIEVALAAPQRVTALWLIECDPAVPQAGGPDMAGGLEATPDAVIGMLAGLVVHKDATDSAAIFQEWHGRSAVLRGLPRPAHWVDGQAFPSV